MYKRNDNTFIQNRLGTKTGYLGAPQEIVFSSPHLSPNLLLQRLLLTVLNEAKSVGNSVCSGMQCVISHGLVCQVFSFLRLAPRWLDLKLELISLGELMLFYKHRLECK